MNLELGETYSGRFLVTDSADPPQPGAATVTANVLLPSGTMVPIVPSTPVLGTYDLDYVTAAIGRHEVYASATGGVLGSQVRKFTDVFNVDPVASGALISLGDAKAHLNIPTDEKDHDEELYGFLLTASRFVENKTQWWHVAQVVEQFTNPSRTILLGERPVVSINSIDQNGTLTGAETYIVNVASGIVDLAYLPWVANAQFTVTYTVGSAYVPPEVRHAVKVVTAHLWRTQRGSVSVGPIGPDEIWDPRFGFSYPRAVAEMLQDYEPGPAFA